MFERLPNPIAVALVALLFASGCATYSDNVREAHNAVGASQPEQAVMLLNEQLQAQGSHELPAEYDDDVPLLLMERGTLLQAMGEYELAARDMMAADDQLEFLDLTNAESMEIAKYMYSESAEKYRAPAYERLLLNSMNMLNFLALGDVQSAKVEARRFQLLEQFFLDADEPAILGGILGLGNYLAGATFESAREYETAARYYSHAWYYGMRNPDFRARLTTLLNLTGYKPRELQADDKDALSGLLEEAKLKEPMSFDEYRQRFRNGDTLIVVQTGLVPWREAKRIPIGTAVTYTEGSRHSMDDEKQEQMQVMIASGALDSVNFPMLTSRNTPPERTVNVKVGEDRLEAGIDIDLASQVERAYAQIMPSMMVAAITRLITRQIAGEAGKKAAEAAGGGGGLGLLTKLAVQGTMNLADKPDTRSWMMLPARVRVIRAQLGDQAGSVTVNVGSRTDSRQVEIHQHSLNVVNFSRLR
jgi:uncharacterized protein